MSHQNNIQYSDYRSFLSALMLTGFATVLIESRTELGDVQLTG